MLLSQITVSSLENPVNRRNHQHRQQGRTQQPKQQRNRQPLEDRVEQDRGGVLGEYGLSEEQGNEIIMAARAHWFEDEPATEEAADADSSQ